MILFYLTFKWIFCVSLQIKHKTMILIADSGGSKTDWALVEEENADNRQILKGRTQGLNPFSSVGGCYFTCFGM